MSTPESFRFLRPDQTSLSAMLGKHLREAHRGWQPCAEDPPSCLGHGCVGIHHVVRSSRNVITGGAPCFT
jgi:hypothetical protein